MSDSFNDSHSGEATLRSEDRWDSASELSELVVSYCERLSAGLRSIAADEALQAAAHLIVATLSAQSSVFVAGNGGSAATASHFATDISLILSERRESIPRWGSIYSLSASSPLLSAIANDFGTEDCFSRQLTALARPEDLLIVLSVSGRSPNIVQACRTAKHERLSVVGLLGEGGVLDGITTISVTAPGVNYGRVEDMHMIMCHVIASFVRQRYREGHLAAPARRLDRAPCE